MAGMTHISSKTGPFLVCPRLLGDGATLLRSARLRVQDSPGR